MIDVLKACEGSGDLAYEGFEPPFLCPDVGGMSPPGDDVDSVLAVVELRGVCAGPCWFGRGVGHG